MAKTILKWVIFLTLASYVIFAAAWARTEAYRHTCKGIDINIVSGTAIDSVTTAGILSELNKYPEKIKGTQLNALDTKKIENYLSAMPQFEEVNCLVTSDGNLNINVVPMVPAVRVFDGGKSYYINKDGKMMDSKASFFVDVPVVSGNFSANFPAVKVLPVVKFVDSDPVLKKLVGMVHANDPRNIYLVPRIQGHIINFGDTTDLAAKRDALLTFYKKVMPYKGWEEYDTISVKFKGQIVATRRNKARLTHGGQYDEEIDMEEATLPDITGELD